MRIGPEVAKTFMEADRSAGFLGEVEGAKTSQCLILLATESARAGRYDEAERLLLEVNEVGWQIFSVHAEQF